MRSVLIVDDSALIRKFTRNIFITLGFDIAEAADGQMALAAFKQKTPDLIMLDWNMPVMNGLEFLAALRKAPNGDQPIVIFCTTESEMSKIQTALIQGANEYIMKPFDAEILRSKLVQFNLF